MVTYNFNSLKNNGCKCYCYNIGSNFITYLSNKKITPN